MEHPTAFVYIHRLRVLKIISYKNIFRIPLFFVYCISNLRGDGLFSVTPFSMPFYN